MSDEETAERVRKLHNDTAGDIIRSIVLPTRRNGVAAVSAKGARWSEGEAAALASMIARRCTNVQLTAAFPQHSLSSVRNKVKRLVSAGLVLKRTRGGGPGRPAAQMRQLRDSYRRAHYGRLGVPVDRIDDYRLFMRKGYRSAEAAGMIAAQIGAQRIMSVPAG